MTCVARIIAVLMGVALAACASSQDSDRDDGGQVAKSMEDASTGQRAADAGAANAPSTGKGGGGSDASTGAEDSSPLGPGGDEGGPNAGDAGNIQILCRNNADCSNGEVCCGPVLAGTAGFVVACFPQCPGACDTLEQCSATSDCPSGETCESTGAGVPFCFASADAGSASDAVAAAVDAGPYGSCLTGGAGRTDCGAASESCCTSLQVPGGTFFRTYDPQQDAGPLAPDGGPLDLADPATLSTFMLDKYPVTVGRFRQFVQAWNSGWTPPAGAGKHTHLNGGNGLNVTSGGYEPGWVPSDDADIAPTDANLRSCCPYSTWSSSPGANENLPMDCVNWYESYAFCIWDGAFLPSDAEFEYAAAGGAEQREYPWGSADPGTANQYAIYGTDLASGGGDCFYPTVSQCVGVANIAPVGTPVLGAARWGHLDMTGNVYQMTLDDAEPEANPCTDCVNLFSGGHYPVARGAEFNDLKSSLLVSRQTVTFYTPAYPLVGFRCARTP